jgi:hypothetical protein
VLAALQSAVAQVNGVRVASQMQSLRAGLHVDVDDEHVGDIRADAFTQQMIAGSQGAVLGYEILSQDEVRQLDEETIARVRASDEGWSFKGSASGEATAKGGGLGQRQESYDEKVSVDAKRGASSFDSDVTHRSMRSYWKVRVHRLPSTAHRTSRASRRSWLRCRAPRPAAMPWAMAAWSADEVADAIRARLSDTLTQTQRFIVLDREFGDELQAEIDHINSGNVRLQDTARVGQQLATDLILIPTIERFEYPRSVRNLRMSDRQVTSYSGGGRITLRLINATTGQVVMSDSFDHQLASTGPSTLPRVVNGRNMAAAMMESLSGQIGTTIVTTLFPVSVVSVDGDQVVLSQGGETLQAGQRWQAVRLGEELKDPQTGRSLGRSEHPCCTIRIDRVAAQTSYGTIEDGVDAMRGGFRRARSNCARSWAASRPPPQVRLPRPLPPPPHARRPSRSPSPLPPRPKTRTGGTVGSEPFSGGKGSDPFVFPRVSTKVDTHQQQWDPAYPQETSFCCCFGCCRCFGRCRAQPWRIPLHSRRISLLERAMKRVVLGVLALSVSSALMAATPKFDGARISADVKELASDAYEGRSPATAGEEKTIAYLSKQFADAGLQPGGDLKDGKRLWTQAVPLRKGDIVGAPQLALHQGGKTLPLEQGKQIAVRAAMNGASNVDISKAPLVFLGYGVKAPERNWDDFKGVDLKGKIAVVLINDPDFETGQGDFDGKGMTYYGRWTYKYEEGARQGALGVLIVHETAPASYGWATVAGSNTNTMFDVVRDNPAESHPLLEGWIQRDLAVELFRSAGQDFEALKKKAQQRDFTPVPLTGASLDAKYAVKTEVITSHNVAARLEGSRHPDETIIYSAHWDHIGVGEPDARGDRIFNGALDNASGTASLIELARGFAKEKRPQRSLLFLAVTAEEKGLLGSSTTPPIRCIRWKRPWR